jgi:hypothetical protein
MAKKGDFDFEFDLKGFERSLTKIEKKVLPQAQAGFLNGLAFGARRSLIAYAEKNIEGSPNSWTKRGFVVKKATTPDPEYSVEILPEQAKYMTYLVSGGERRAGDPGATKYDVRVDSAPESKNRFGNAQRYFLSRTSKKAKREKDKRLKLKARRDKLRASGKSVEVATWAANAKSADSGVFFGRIRNTRGYWQRPEQRGGKLKLLVRFADAAKYDPKFKWDATIESYIRAANLQKMYSSEITRALRKLNSR